MIIFDLDGTLADCENKKHFIDKTHSHHKRKYFINSNCGLKPDWKSFYEAHDKDNLILQSWRVFIAIVDTNSLENIQIWSARCESTRQKTQDWIAKNISLIGEYPEELIVKMRAVGDNTPSDQLKEKWLDEAISEGDYIEFVFDGRPKDVRMWKRRGIFVFNCFQRDEEFY